jgi:hypothetical protein
MIQRFLFDRIDAKPARSPIGRQNNLVLPSRTDKAEPPLPFLERAIAGTQIALDASIL